MDGNTWIIIAVVAALLIVLVFFLGRSKEKPDDTKATPPVESSARPSKDLLSNRDEVAAPVEIHDGMSLAELKRAKAARVVGEKGRRETAQEATKRNRADHSEVTDDSDGWGAMVDDTNLDFSSSALSEVSEAPRSEHATKPVIPKLAPVVEETSTSLTDGLAKTRKGFIGRLGDLFKGDELDENLVEEVEEILYTADIGAKAAADILEAIQSQLTGDDRKDPARVWGFVRKHVQEKLSLREKSIDFDAHTPFVILVVGVNGAGKTTTIGKLASKFQKQGKKVLMVAGDTFRAAAVEQLAVWGDRTNIPVHQGESDADPASVVFAGIEKGVADGVDVIICDTAGRLHTNVNLLDELRKIRRVASKVIDSAPHETFLVLDANTGQNAIQQARLFSEAVDISGIVLTKLDGTAKGGVILGICEELEAPIRYIGVGEGVADLREFKASEFVEALFM
jgi:fused signal recognition particle receptor